MYFIRNTGFVKGTGKHCQRRIPSIYDGISISLCNGE